jgi:hypothetical protein
MGLVMLIGAPSEAGMALLIYLAAVAAAGWFSAFFAPENRNLR